MGMKIVIHSLREWKPHAAESSGPRVETSCRRVIHSVREWNFMPLSREPTVVRPETAFPLAERVGY